MASRGPEGAAAGHGLEGSGGAEEMLDFAAGRKTQPPLSAQSAFSFIPTSREGPPELSYFNRKAKTGDVSTYDAIFKRQEGYNKHLHRSDRQHAKSRGLNIIEEEMARPVAVLSSSEHGKRINKPLEQPVKTHARINHVKADFYRRNGIICLTERPCPSLHPC
ncbi:cilia- and flagella-associated protein 90 [Pezoporus flaviventris]|uniref:cilia- and flagella-associated protein 90 n=1 Tax=Pezoporus flaviventris TaxID=889875 RepID=UPI002AB2292F|nr:cilia- and flagella-associated protein 90 [Pezoporus flaviventris]